MDTDEVHIRAGGHRQADELIHKYRSTASIYDKKQATVNLV